MELAGGARRPPLGSAYAWFAPPSNPHLWLLLQGDLQLDMAVDSRWLGPNADGGPMDFWRAHGSHRIKMTPNQFLEMLHFVFVAQLTNLVTWQRRWRVDRATQVGLVDPTRQPLVALPSPMYSWCFIFEYFAFLPLHPNTFKYKRNHIILKQNTSLKLI